MKTSTRLGALCLALACGAVPAQMQDVRAPTLLAADGAERPIVLERATVDVQALGGTAETRIELEFRNPNDRVLEGQLRFPLRPGQQVAGFALDIDGRLREAVPVPKAKGQAVFEAIERRQVDPALLEATEGNFFRLRVYPVPARGTRRVVLRMVDAMPPDAAGWRLRLPLGFARDVPSVALRVRGPRPRVEGTLAPVVLRRDGRADIPRGRLPADGDLDIVFAAPAAPAAHVQTHDGETHLVADVALPGAASPHLVPRVVGLLWDSSASGRRRDHAAELALLQRYIARTRMVEFRLIRLRDRAEPPKRFVVAAGDWSALRAELESTIYDGATDPGGWTPEPDVGEYLLVSDGLFNYGDRRLPTLLDGQRLLAFHAAGAAADDVRLQALARTHGGRAVAIAGAADVERAARVLLTEPPRIVGVESPGLADVVWREPGDGTARIAARVLEPPSTLAVRVRDASGESVRTIALPATAEDGRLAGRLWADAMVRRLQDDPDRHRARIARIGQRFGLVNAETSLIVLDDVADYVAHDIEPPAELRAAFDAMRAARRDDTRVAEAAHLDRIVAGWDARATWWSTPWPKGRPPAPQRDERRDREAAVAATAGDERASQRSERPMPTAAMAPPPAPAPAVPPPGADEAMSLDRIEVTGSRVGPELDDAPAATIALQPWQPDSPYARRLRAAAPEAIYGLYLDERDSHADSTAFYLDVAALLFERRQADLALRVLSNLAELDLENRHLLRVLAYRLAEADRHDLALPVLQRIVRLADEEPQSHRDLGLALAALGRSQEAADALYTVVRRPWDSRFDGVAEIALAELNDVIADAATPVDTAAYDRRLLRHLPVGLRAVLGWDSDNSDMDLWVTDPNGERCYYSNRATYQGGRMSEDFTGGYGPEEFVLRAPKPGRYRVEANFYGDSQQIVTGATTLHLWLSTGFGTAAQKDQRVTLRLAGKAETVLVGEFEVR